MAVAAQASLASPGTYRAGASVVTVDPSTPVFMGGYGGGPGSGTLERHVDPLTGRAEDFTARAIAISAGGHVVELERVDSQGWYAGYQEGPYGISDVRQKVAAYLRTHGDPAARPADILVSTLHEHAAPSIQGIWGPPRKQVGYLKQVAAAAEAALEQAYLRMRPAVVRWGSADAPWLDSTNIANANANEGWPNDGSLLALWARDAKTGQTIATYVSEPAYPNIVYGPGDLKCPKGVEAALLSTDFPSYTQNYLEQRLGGVALVASGTLGDQPGPMQGDSAASADLPPVIVKGHTCKQTVAWDDDLHMAAILGNLISEALAHGHLISNPQVASAEQYILTPVYNPLLVGLNNVAPLAGGSPWDELGDPGAYPTDRSTSPPYEDGLLIGTWVTGLRIGDVLILSEPGEFFPSVHQAWDRAIHGAAGVFVVGMGQDQLGYDFPAYAYPFTYYSADENLFNPSLTLGDQVVTAGEQDAHGLGFAVDYTSTAEQTALNNQYQRAAQPGIQFIPFPQSGDIDPLTGGFTDVLEGFATPPRFNRTTPCNLPVVPSLPSCPMSAPTIGPIHWTFGDGTTYIGGNGAAKETDYFHHSFCRPGRYEVNARATDSDGKSDSFTLPITVYPALRAAIVKRDGRLSAQVLGGDGVTMYLRWQSGESSYLLPSIPAPTAGTVALTVVDGTGTEVVVTATLRDDHLGVQHTTYPVAESLATGVAAGPACPAPRAISGSGKRVSGRRARRSHRSRTPARRRGFTG